MVEARNLSYAAGKRTILRGLDFSIAKGDFVLVFGQNGAGKSTLLRLLAGMLHAEKGEIFLGGKSTASFSKRELAARLCYLPQSADFVLPILVRDILWAGRYPYRSLFRKPGGLDREIFAAGVEQFQLAGLLERNMQTLSGGERKKVLLASAFIQDVPLILLDEPLSFLDPGSAYHLVRLLEALNRDGKTIVVVSHELEHFFPLASKLLALKNGELSYFGAKAFSAELLREVYQVSFHRIQAAGREIIFVQE
jgi:iron complex transport system ATP-binding protein